MDHVEGHKYARTGGNHTSRTGKKFERKTGRRAGTHAIEHDPGPPPERHKTTRETRKALQEKAAEKKRKAEAREAGKKRRKAKREAKKKRGNINTKKAQSAW